MKHQSLKHPTEQELALHAGGDLGWLSAWRVRRHVNRCEPCRQSVEAFRAFGPDAARWGELPPDLDWSRLAMEMKANIRLGLESAGTTRGGSLRRGRRSSCVTSRPSWARRR